MSADLTISLSLQEAQVLKQALDRVQVQGVQGMAYMVAIYSKLDIALAMAQKNPNGVAGAVEATKPAS